MFSGATAFTFAGHLSAWDVRVVAVMDGMFDFSYHNASASFCGFYWTTSSTAIVAFEDLIPDINIDADPAGEICHCPVVSEGGREGGTGIQTTRPLTLKQPACFPSCQILRNSQTTHM